MRIVAGVMFLAGLLAVTSLAEAQPPGGGKGQPGKGGFGGKGGGFGEAFAQPGQVMPTFIAEMLKLNDDQKKQMESLQKEVDEKLAKILNDEQKKQLSDLKERGGAGGFGGGKGGPGGGFGGKGGKGGFGGKGKGDPPPE